MDNKAKDFKIIRMSLIINLIIVVFTIAASIMMFTGFRFMHGYEPVLESTKIGMLRFFTVESNIFMGIIALIFAINEIEIIKGKKAEIPIKSYILKLMSTTAVGLTFLVVFAYLGPISKYGIASMLMNSNLFFHLIIPVLSMINFAFIEKTDRLKFKYTFFGIIPAAAYGVYYLINIMIHMENGKVSPKYDWYWFVQNGVWTVIIVLPMMIAITYLISLILWKINKKRNK